MLALLWIDFGGLPSALIYTGRGDAATAPGIHTRLHPASAAPACMLHMTWQYTHSATACPPACVACGPAGHERVAHAEARAVCAVRGLLARRHQGGGGLHGRHGGAVGPRQRQAAGQVRGPSPPRALPALHARCAPTPRCPTPPAAAWNTCCACRHLAIWCQARPWWSEDMRCHLCLCCCSPQSDMHLYRARPRSCVLLRVHPGAARGAGGVPHAAGQAQAHAGPHAVRVCCLVRDMCGLACRLTAPHHSVRRHAPAHVRRGELPAGGGILR